MTNTRLNPDYEENPVQWNPELENLIRTYGEYQERKFKDRADPKKSAIASSLRSTFLARTTRPIFEDIIKETNCAIFTNPYDGGTAMSFSERIEDIVLIAKLNNSNAADKLEAILLILKREEELFQDCSSKRYKKTKERYEKGGLLQAWEKFKIDSGSIKFFQGQVDNFRVLKIAKRENSI